MYKRKTVDLWEIQVNYGYGWDVVTIEETFAEAKYMAKTYRENEPYPIRIHKIREPLKGIVAD